MRIASGNRLVAIALLATLSACEDIAGLSKVERPGRISFYDQISTLSAPDTVARNATFNVQFQSFESRCTDIPGRANVAVRVDSVLIYPVVNSARQCNADALLILTYSVPVRVDRAGALTIALTGRKEDATSSGDTVISRRIVLR
jgi:hypothetical protein